MNHIELRRKDLLFPELSYKINGALFEVFRQLGGGHAEKSYQRATSSALSQSNLKFTEQYYVPLKFNNQIVGKYYLDFLIEGKVILELKRGKFVPARIISQVKGYLQSLGLQLALIACFTEGGVVIKRIISINAK